MVKIEQWLKSTPYRDFEISIASADASFRSYYRLTKEQESYILMDSSLELESLAPFLDITKRLRDVGVNAPEIFEYELNAGYLIIEDFGTRHYLDILNAESFHTLYTKAIDTIITMQKSSTENLPLYDKAYLHFEMDLMQEWYLEGLLKKELTLEQKELILETLERISALVLTQPQGYFVHRDFHSRNILQKEDKSLGIIDYQDAMSGAICYDLVSLLKDCYIEFNAEEIERLALTFRDKRGLDIDDATFIKWFDFMGLQRHIKVLGVFSRLFLRDKKDGYLKDIPLVLKYVFDTAIKYDETKEFANFLKAL